MKTKIPDKKEKKLSLNKTKTKQQKNVKSKKVAKQVKLAISIQNGNPILENKVQDFKIVGKQKWKQNKEAKQNIITVPSKIKIKTKAAKEETSSTTAESKKDILKTDTTKRLEYLERRQKRRNSRKRKRQHRYDSVASVKLNVEQVKKKIEEIRSRKVLSNTAKRTLAVLNRKLRVEESANKSNKLDTNESDKLDTVGRNNKKGKHIQIHKHKIDQEDELVKSKQANNKDKIKAKKKHIKNRRNKIKKDERDDINVMRNNDEDESKEDQSAAEKEMMDTVKEQIDDESNEYEVDEEDTDNEASSSKVKKGKKKQSVSLDYPGKEEMKKKKKRYVLSVGNLPPNVTADEIKQHFLIKLGITTKVKIHSDATHKFAYVVTANFLDFKKGLLLNDTFFMKKRINVQYSMPKDNKKTDVIKTSPVAKSKKLQTLRKAGKLVKNQENQGKKKQFKKKQKSGRPKA